MAALVKSWYYLPCAPGQVERSVRRWLGVYGCAPEFIGRLWRSVSSGVCIWRCDWPVYIGPIPHEDIGLWPGADYVTERDLRGLFVWRNNHWELERDREAVRYYDWRANV